jgi:hypothetical protein
MSKEGTEDSSAKSAGIIRLRLNLGAAGPKTVDKVVGNTKSPHKNALKKVVGMERMRRVEGAEGTERMEEAERVERVERVVEVMTTPSEPGQATRNNSKKTFQQAVNDDENRKQSCNTTAPKFTVRLKATAPLQEEESKRKIILSMRRRPEERSESIDVETIDQPTKRDRNVSGQKAKKIKFEHEALPMKKDVTRKVTGSITHPFATVPITKPTLPIPTSTAQLQRTNSSMRVAIPTLSSYNSMTPGEREEERIFRQCITEVFSSLWSKVQKPELEVEFKGWKDLSDTILPYWLMLAPIDSAYNAPTLKTTTVEADRLARTAEELAKLRERMSLASLKQTNREIPTELLVLEQKLCWEEEKLLCAKLRGEYNQKVNEIVARKRQAEGASTASNAANPHQRILPKGAPAAWAAGHGIQIVRGPDKT